MQSASLAMALLWVVPQPSVQPALPTPILLAVACCRVPSVQHTRHLLPVLPLALQQAQVGAAPINMEELGMLFTNQNTQCCNMASHPPAPKAIAHL